MIKSIILALLCFLIFLAAHVILFRLLRPEKRFRTLVAIYLALIPAYIAAYLLTPDGFTVVSAPGVPGAPLLPLETVYRLTGVINFASGLVLYTFLFLGYCQFYFIVDRSISVRIMIELLASPRRRLSLDEIEKVYPCREIFRRRLEHMVDGRYLRESGGYYEVTGKGRLEGLLFKFLKELLVLGRGG